MPSERRFRDDGTKTTRSYKPDDGDDRMGENDEDVVHAGIVSNLKNSRNSGRFFNSPPTGISKRGADVEKLRRFPRVLSACDLPVGAIDKRVGAISQ